jgi:hypothetical protein
MCRHFDLTYNVPSMTRNLLPKKHHIGIILTPTNIRATPHHLPSLTVDSFNELGINHDTHQESPLMDLPRAPKLNEVVISHLPIQHKLEF